MRRILAILLENEAGSLSRIVGLFSQRGYNIESLIVAPTEDPSLSRLTLTTSEDAKVIDQIIKQLNKLIDVVKVLDLGKSEYVERELMLVKFNRSLITDLELDELSGEIVFENLEVINVQFVGDSSHLNEVLKKLNSKSPLEVVRTGTSGISSSTKTLTIN